MSKVNPKASALIDQYIAKQTTENQAILNKLRQLILSVDDRIMEDWKWGAPSFNYKGLLCWAASFKGMVGMNFFKGLLIKDTYNLFLGNEDDEKGNRIIHIESLEKINVDAISNYVLQALELNELGMKVPKKEIIVVVPKYFQVALKENPKAKEVFENFAPSHQREYMEWITDAKREATREKRINQTIEWLIEGKHRNWKYEKC